VLSLASSSLRHPSTPVCSSDAFGTLDDVAQQLGDLPINHILRGEDKLRLPLNLGPGAARPSEMAR
jgi:hypothetical protein